MDHELSVYLFGLAAALLVGLSKTGVPGVAIPAILLMTEAFSGNEKLSVGALLPMLLVGDVIAVRLYRQHADWKRLWRLFPYVVAGMIPGVVVLLLVENEQFRLVLGWIVLPLLVMEVGRQWLGWTALPAHGWFTALMGLLAGFGTTVGNAAGPVMSVYLISHGLPKERFMGTWAWFFLIANLSKLPIYGTLGMITPTTLTFDLVVGAMVVVGALVGRRLFLVIPQRLFNALVLVLAAIAALRLIGLVNVF
ncbi:MAG: sulfite exporter TauE/SafE family protein [Planctomycetes bacterium]|nr:sulfite exporter TauE/SafE family protein [Planctomycetota bacterium]